MINCFLDNKDSIGKCTGMRIIIENGKVTFNMKKFVDLFLSKMKKPEKFKQAFNVDVNELFSKKFVDNHFSFSISSKIYPNKNVSKNYTSSNTVKVIDHNNIEKRISCMDKSNPNLKGELKNNYLTPSYELNKDKTIINEIPKNLVLNMQTHSKNVCSSIILDKDKPLLISENGKLYSKENSPTIKEYTKEYKIPVYDSIKSLSDFESSNESILESEETQKEYTICKYIMRTGKYYENSLNSSNDNSPYESFIN